MNANEVIAELAGDEAHPNDHVNMGQSSNDVFPSAVHLAALGEVHSDLLPALDELRSALERKAEEFADHVKAGRTHLMDAGPGHPGPGVRRLRRAGAAWRRPRARHARPGGPDPARRDGHRHRAQHRTRSSRQRSASGSSADTGLDISEPADPFEAQANRDALVELSGSLKVVAVSLIKIAGDLALMGSGPRAGLAEILLPELQKGSVDHARQGQPRDPGGRDPGGRPGDRQRRGDRDRRVPRDSSSSTCGCR